MKMRLAGLRPEGVSRPARSEQEKTFYKFKMLAPRPAIVLEFGVFERPTRNPVTEYRVARRTNDSALNHLSLRFLISARFAIGAVLRAHHSSGPAGNVRRTRMGSAVFNPGVAMKIDDRDADLRAQHREFETQGPIPHNRKRRWANA